MACEGSQVSMSMAHQVGTCICVLQAGPGTSNTTGSGDAANGPADGAGDVAPRTESGTAVWDKAAMARMPTQVR
jgi:hypothetical protein